MGALGPSATGLTFARAVWRLVRRVPRGRVVTYGQLAALLGRPRAARRVGWALRICPPDLPWHRVVNAQGAISVRGGASRRPSWGWGHAGRGELSNRRARRWPAWGRGPSGRGEPTIDSMTTQRLRLAAEGVTLRRGRVALARHRWRPRTP